MGSWDRKGLQAEGESALPEHWLEILRAHFSTADSLTSRGVQYPTAFQCYKEHCEAYQEEIAHHDIVDLQSEDDDTLSVRLPLGTALVIPPQPEDYNNGKKKHWIVCLFTSSGFGNRVDSPDQILNSTYAALEDLDMQLVMLKQPNEEIGDGQPPPGALFSCRFNSGLFAVPWNDTRELIDDLGLGMTVIYPEGE
jgi:ADP-ribose 1''-phosphate phosphatase